MRPYGTTVLRVVVGVVYAMNAYLEVVVFTPTGVAALMARAGLPASGVLAWCAIAIHALGGLMLIAGLWTRLAAGINAVVILAALVKVHLPQGFFLKAFPGQSGIVGYEFVGLLLGASLALVLLGSGPLALTRSK